MTVEVVAVGDRRQVGLYAENRRHDNWIDWHRDTIQSRGSFNKLGGGGQAGGSGRGGSGRAGPLGRRRAGGGGGGAANQRAGPCGPLGGGAPPAASDAWWWGAPRRKRMITVLAQPPVRHRTSTEKWETREKGNKQARGQQTLPETRPRAALCDPWRYSSSTQKRAGTTTACGGHENGRDETAPAAPPAPLAARSPPAATA